MTMRHRPSDVVAAIVTYGERKRLLLPVLERLRAEGVGRAIVIDNGARWPVAQYLADRFGDWARVVSMRVNAGSSAGFAAAFTAASESGLPLIWVLDDDNRPHENCLDLLLAAHVREATVTSDDLLAVVASRAEHAIGDVSERQLMTRWDSFGGFHIADITGKITRRLFGNRTRPSARDRQVGVTHFGGMLFHRDLLERFGIPQAAFFMYGDDTEFTWRITAAGGRIVQIGDAVIEDLEPAAQETARLRNRFSATLLSPADFRSYYATRNMAFFEDRFRKKNSTFFRINQAIYLSILRFYAWKLNRMEKLAFLRAAIRDGLNGAQGPDMRFPLG